MARTIRDKLDGIVSFWTFRHISNASMEGFNNKIRWLIRQACGFRDREYFKLKIYQLPEISGVLRNCKLCQGSSKRLKMARETGLEPATSTVTGWYSNQLSYSPAFAALVTTFFKISPFYRFSNRIQQKNR